MDLLFGDEAATSLAKAAEVVWTVSCFSMFAQTTHAVFRAHTHEVVVDNSCIASPRMIFSLEICLLRRTLIFVSDRLDAANAALPPQGGCRTVNELARLQAELS